MDRTDIDYLREQLRKGGFRGGEDSWDADSDGNIYVQLRGKKLRLRFIHAPDETVMHLACEESFDRWANSVDFIVPFWPKNVLQVCWEARKRIRAAGPDSFQEFGKAVDLSEIAQRFA